MNNSLIAVHAVVTFASVMNAQAMPDRSALYTLKQMNSDGGMVGGRYQVTPRLLGWYGLGPSRILELTGEPEQLSIYLLNTLHPSAL